MRGWVFLSGAEGFIFRIKDRTYLYGLTLCLYPGLYPEPDNEDQGKSEQNDSQTVEQLRQGIKIENREQYQGGEELTHKPEGGEPAYLSSSNFGWCQMHYPQIRVGDH